RQCVQGFLLYASEQKNFIPLWSQDQSTGQIILWPYYLSAGNDILNRPGRPIYINHKVLFCPDNTLSDDDMNSPPAFFGYGLYVLDNSQMTATPEGIQGDTGYAIAAPIDRSPFSFQQQAIFPASSASPPAGLPVSGLLPPGLPLPGQSAPGP